MSNLIGNGMREDIIESLAHRVAESGHVEIATEIMNTLNLDISEQEKNQIFQDILHGWINKFFPVGK